MFAIAYLQWTIYKIRTSVKYLLITKDIVSSLLITCLHGVCLWSSPPTNRSNLGVQLRKRVTQDPSTLRGKWLWPQLGFVNHRVSKVEASITNKQIKKCIWLGGVIAWNYDFCEGKQVLRKMNLKQIHEYGNCYKSPKRQLSRLHISMPLLGYDNYQNSREGDPSQVVTT